MHGLPRLTQPRPAHVTRSCREAASRAQHGALDAPRALRILAGRRSLQLPEIARGLGRAGARWAVRGRCSHLPGWRAPPAATGRPPSSSPAAALPPRARSAQRAAVVRPCAGARGRGRRCTNECAQPPRPHALTPGRRSGRERARGLLGGAGSTAVYAAVRTQPRAGRPTRARQWAVAHGMARTCLPSPGAGARGWGKPTRGGAQPRPQHHSLGSLIVRGELKASVRAPAAVPALVCSGYMRAVEGASCLIGGNRAFCGSSGRMRCPGPRGVTRVAPLAAVASVCARRGER